MHVKKCMLRRSRNMTFFKAPNNMTDCELIYNSSVRGFTQCACILQLAGDSCNLSDDSGLGEDNLGDGGSLLDNVDGSLDDLAELELLVSFVGKRETASLVHCKSDLMRDRNMLCNCGLNIQFEPIAMAGVGRVPLRLVSCGGAPLCGAAAGLQRALHKVWG